LTIPATIGQRALHSSILGSCTVQGLHFVGCTHALQPTLRGCWYGSSHTFRAPVRCAGDAFDAGFRRSPRNPRELTAGFVSSPGLWTLRQCNSAENGCRMRFFGAYPVFGKRQRAYRFEPGKHACLDLCMSIQILRKKTYSVLVYNFGIRRCRRRALTLRRNRVSFS